MDVKRITAVETLKDILYEKTYKDEDYEMYSGDLSLHYLEIIREISKVDKSKTSIIFDYAKLLQQEINLWSETEAYIAGQEAKDKPDIKVLVSIDRKISATDEKQRLDNEMQKSYNEIKTLLRETSGLIADFTELFGKLHGVVKNNLLDFIRLGQSTETNTAME